MGDRLEIRSVTARPVMVPLDRPVRTAAGDIPATPLVLIDVATTAGVIGRSYLFAYTRPVLVPLARLVSEIGAELTGAAVAPALRMRALERRFRLLGLQGLVGMAIAGLDMAFWDILARAADLPLASLLGGAPRPIRAYASFGIIDVAADERVILDAVAAGFQGLKIKVGGADFARDLADIAAVRTMIGPGIALMVDYNQSLDPTEALRRAAALAKFDLTWIEEPVAAEDLAGHARVRAGSPVPVQTGENWWFPRAAADAVAAGASDHAMLDVMKIGGVTGWLEAAALAKAASLPVSSHSFLEASAHLLAVTPTALWLEHLDKASRLLERPLAVERGCVTAQGPGLGLEWNEMAVDRLLV
ncbi:mandelate racemase [Aliidongia dinghuensis]|uniref:Mandelate racemase n=1 Tax=Aliidongia dinghuensis TaxID=1867774 RepID=A0A8J3E5Q6_9PROT|nr:enolase C-terminal domain-like protein [Aliidongia dinghuensis]GGF37103.1 mandelate racemase [Aliidongia dinghuensis]